MPEYLYQNSKTEEIISIIQGINQDHIYIDTNGLKWNRIYTVPQLNTDGTLKSDCTAKQFSEYTSKKNGNLGDLFDRSAELSEKRSKIIGKDPIKEKYFKDWSAKRKGKKHPLSDKS